jgi:hypothetical protein
MFNTICSKCGIIYLFPQNRDKKQCQCGEKLKPVLVPNYFDKEILEDMVGKKISTTDFKAFIDSAIDNLADQTSETVLQYWNDTE